ncbi:MAG TPA: GUN4 domain-containing protein [Oculatellaceae cyanobacterium]
MQFVGRQRELSILHQQLQDNKLVAVSAIAGMGGVGKTELALQYAHKYKETYPAGICWLQTKAVGIGTQIVGFGRSRLRLNPPDEDILVQVEFCWAHWHPGEVLVVLDDVSDYEVIKPYLPPADSRFKVLITTRVQLGQSIKQLEIDVLDQSAALALLESLIGAERIQQELNNAKKLCTWLGYLPLGLELMGRYLNRKPDLSLVEMRQQLESKRLEARALTKTDADMTARFGVAATFELSWEMLDEPAKQLGCVLSLFALAPIPWSLVEQAISEQTKSDLDEIRDESLCSLHLLQRERKGSYRMHQLIREFFQKKLQQLAQADELKRGVCRAIATRVKQIYENPTLEEIATATPDIPHLFEVAGHLRDCFNDVDLRWVPPILDNLYQMIAPDELNSIIERIATGKSSEDDLQALLHALTTKENALIGRIAVGKYTEDDLQVLLRALSTSKDQNILQLGKYNVNIGQGNEIHIGDRIYFEWNEEAIQKLVEVIRDQSNSIPLLPKELPQEEYIRLKNLLMAGRWREANETTRNIILKAVKAEKEGWLTEEQIQNFPCQVLQVIDRLWLEYSNQRFGFSVQKRIFNQCEKEPQAFGDHVGWHIQNTWISASQVIYNPAKAPVGHLPWGIMSVITMDNAALDAFVHSLRTVTKTTIRQDWQKQLLADFMAFGGSLLGDKVDKEEFKRNLEYELSQDEAWWKGQRLEELKVRKLFSLLAACPNL